MPWAPEELLGYNHPLCRVGGTFQTARDAGLDVLLSHLPLPQSGRESTGTLTLGSKGSLRKLRPAPPVPPLDTPSLGKRPGSCLPLASHLARLLGYETGAWHPSSTRLSDHGLHSFLKNMEGVITDAQGARHRSQGLS